MKQPRELEGLIPDELGDVLAELAGAVPAGLSIVEIGSYKGKSTAYLAAGAPSSVLVYAVDPWNLAGNENGRHGFSEPATREVFDRQIHESGLAPNVVPIQGFSSIVAAAWTGPKVGLLYVDGDHSREAVLLDFAAWKRHLVPEAIIAFDDFDTPKNPGVRDAIEALERAGELSLIAVEADRLAVCELG